MRLLANRLAVLVIFLVLAAGIVVSSAFGATREVGKGELLGIYNRVRKAVMKQDLTAFKQLVIPAEPGTPKPTKEDLADIKDFIDIILPDLSGSVFHKFARTSNEAIFVVQTEPGDKESIHLNVFRFKNKNGRWMLLAEFNSKSFSKQNPTADRQKIKRTLDHNPSFRLQAGAKKTTRQPGSPKAGETGSGFLTVAKKTYNFKYAFAFRKKAFGQKDKINIHVVLTEKAVSIESIKAQLRENDDWSEFISHLTLIFNPDLKPDFANFWVKHDSISFSGPPFYAKGQAKLVEGRIKGNLKMEKPKKLFGDSFIFDVTFNAPIISK